MSNKIEQLKTEWKKWDKSWNSQAEYDAFIEKYKKDKLEELALEDYTNIKENEQTEYFTHWLERKTENCGKFRTASSYAYGIYKVNPNSIQDESERKSSKFKAHDEQYKKSQNYLDEDTAKQYFETTVRPIIVDLAKFKDLETTRPLDINYARKIAYMYNVKELIPIYKKEVLESIADFLGIKDNIDFSSYKATQPILEKIKEVFAIKEDITIELSQKIASFLWENFGKSVSFDSKNIIYYGAPGTGKTYTVQNAVRQRVLQNGDDLNEVSLFTQFHPSFGYEDFIEGLKPQVNAGATELKLTNGKFKIFCKKAMQNLRISRMKNEEPKLYYFIADEVNRADLSTVFGELLLCLEESKRVDFNSDGSLKDGSMTIETQYSYLYTTEEERVFENSDKFGVPSNLFFIGTMNDIDRSIDSFDLALRRRFIWERMDCNYEVIVSSEELKDIEDLEPYISICKKLNSLISKDLGLGKSYEIGHSYFMDIQINQKNITKKSVQDLFDKKLKPLIEEYLRGEYSQLEIEEKLKIANEKFSL